jgi:hypothetical protein
VEETTFLRPVQGVVGRVEVQHDAPALARDRLDAFLDQQLLDLPRIRSGFLVASVPSERTLFQTVDRPGPQLQFPEQQSARSVAAQMAAVETRDDFTPIVVLKLENFLVTHSV